MRKPSETPPSAGSRRRGDRSASAVLLVSALMLGTLAGGCKGTQAAGSASGDREKDMADAVHLVLSADREVYTKQVVNRLQNQEKVIKASEHWKDEKLLPLPAQMFRMGAERVREQSKTMSYALLSLWPINKQNGPRTEAEQKGLKAVADDPSHPQYGQETLNGVRYFTAIYPDRAVSEACVDCHNKHTDSPKKDHELGSVMGAVVIRIAMK
jgi:uncharacterized protein DUF3365